MSVAFNFWRKQITMQHFQSRSSECCHMCLTTLLHRTMVPAWVEPNSPKPVRNIEKPLEPLLAFPFAKKVLLSSDKMAAGMAASILISLAVCHGVQESSCFTLWSQQAHNVLPFSSQRMQIGAVEFQLAANELDERI